MHAANIRTRATSAFIAFLASIAFATSVAPILGSDDSRPEPAIMPGSTCPPLC